MEMEFQQNSFVWAVPTHMCLSKQREQEQPGIVEGLARHGMRES